MSIDVKVNQASYNRLMDRLQALAKDIDNMVPVWDEWEKMFLGAVKITGFEGRGALMGEKWKSLTPKYRKWKQKNFPGKPIMVLSGALKRAATGGQGYESKKTKNQLTMKIMGLNYAIFAHALRPYWKRRDNTLPQRTIVWLLNIMKKRLGLNK